MHHNSQQFQFIPYNKRYIEQSVEKVLNKHINTFLFTRNTTIFELKRLGLMKFIKEAGCVSKEDIYIAFSPHKKIHNNVQQLTSIFDNQIRILMKTGEMHEILRGYNVDSL